MFGRPWGGFGSWGRPRPHGTELGDGKDTSNKETSIKKQIYIHIYPPTPTAGRACESKQKTVPQLISLSADPKISMKTKKSPLMNLILVKTTFSSHAKPSHAMPASKQIGLTGQTYCQSSLLLTSWILFISSQPILYTSTNVNIQVRAGVLHWIPVQCFENVTVQSLFPLSHGNSSKSISPV